MIIFIRTLILYSVVLLALRLMGKSELSKMSTFQMVILFMIAELASIPIDSLSSSLINGIIAIFTLLFLQVLLSYISIKSELVKNFINGRPSILIDKGQINVKEMNRLRISINDLFEQLRIEDCPSISDVEYAIMESNGELSVISKSEQALLPLIIISDGFLYDSNVKKSNLSITELDNELKKYNLSNYKDIFLAFLDCNQKLHIYPTPDKNQCFAKEASL